MKRLFLMAIAALAVAGQAHAEGGDAVAGEEKSRSCHACHGSDGISINDMWPNLAGQKEGYLVKQITAFRDGDRHDPNMVFYVKNLSDEDIADIAAFYAGLSGIEKERATLH